MGSAGQWSLGVSHRVAVKWWFGLQASEVVTVWISRMAHAHGWELVLTVPLDEVFNRSTHVGTLIKRLLIMCGWVPRGRSPKMSISRDPGGNHKPLYNPISEVPEHPFGCILSVN